MKTQSKRWFSSLFATVILVTAIGFNTAIGANINSKTAVNNGLEGSTVDNGNNLLKMAAQSTLNRNAKSGFEYNGVTYKTVMKEPLRRMALSTASFSLGAAGLRDRAAATAAISVITFFSAQNARSTPR